MEIPTDYTILTRSKKQNQEFIKKASENRKRQLVNSNLTQINVLVPVAWQKQKRYYGITWRQLIARGIRHIETRENFDLTLNEFIEKNTKLNDRITLLQRKLYALEEHK